MPLIQGWKWVVMVGVSASLLPFSEVYSFQPTPVEDRVALQCIHEACGSFDRFPSMVRMQQGVQSEDQEFAQFWSERLEPTLRQHYESEVNFQKRLLVAMDSALPKIAQTIQEKGPLNPLSRFAFMVYFASGWPDYMDYIRTNEVKASAKQASALPSVDLKKLKQDFPDEDLTYRLAFLRDFVVPQMAENSSADPMDLHFDNKPGLLAHRLRHRFAKKAPQVSSNDWLSMDASMLMGKVEELRGPLGNGVNLLLDASSKQVLAQALQGTAPTMAEAKIYLQWAQLVEIMYTSIKKLPPPPADRFQEEVGSAVRDLHSAGVKERQLNYYPFDRVQNKCRVQLRYLNTVKQSEHQIQLFARFIPEVKTAARSVIAELFRPELGKELRKVIAKTQAVLPEKPRADLMGFQRELEDGIEQNITLNQLLDQGELETLAWTFFVRAIMNPEDIYGEEAVPSAYKACESLPVLPMGDVADPASARVALSWFAVQYPGNGLGILAHEMAHVLSPEIRKAGPARLLNSETSCLISRNPFAQGTDHFMEEDWADFFAAKVLKELRKSESLQSVTWRNFACGLLRTSSGEEIDRRDLEPYSTDPHSPALLRVVNLARDSGQLLQSCRPVADWMDRNSRMTPAQQKLGMKTPLCNR